MNRHDLDKLDGSSRPRVGTRCAGHARVREHGLSLVEVLVATALLSILVLGLGDVSFSTLALRDELADRNRAVADAQFALERISEALAASPTLLLPRADDPTSPTEENVRTPGLLAVRLDPTLDLDRDGFADADNDKDGRVDEDWPADASFDGKPGLFGLDDSADGTIDGPDIGDDDESTGTLRVDEDPINGIDDDRDGSVDEDPSSDMTGDGVAGLAGVDDDGDGQIDEGAAGDDDEDGSVDEDWIDAIVFLQSGDQLLERRPDLIAIDGSQHTERVLAENVRSFRVERLPRRDRRTELVDLVLEVGPPTDPIRLETRLRLGTRR